MNSKTSIKTLQALSRMMRDFNLTELTVSPEGAIHMVAKAETPLPAPVKEAKSKKEELKEKAPVSFSDSVANNPRYQMFQVGIK